MKFSEFINEQEQLNETTKNQFMGRNGYPMFIRALGNYFVVRGIFTDDNSANKFMEKNKDTGVINEVKFQGKNYIIVAENDEYKGK